jgi:hypothetical protein
MLNPAPQPKAKERDDMREFMIVVRQALLVIVSYIERRYGLQRKRTDYEP